jgi:uncharacterized protein
MAVRARSTGLPRRSGKEIADFLPRFESKTIPIAPRLDSLSSDKTSHGFRQKWNKKMTGTTSRQRVLHLLDTYYAGDIEAALAGCSDDIEYFAPAPIDILPHMGQHRGKDSVRKAWQTIRARYSDMRHEVRTIVAGDDAVAVYVRAFLTKRTNGRIIQFDSAMFFRLHENRIASIRQIIDTFDLVQQVLERDLGALLTGDTQA